MPHVKRQTIQIEEVAITLSEITDQFPGKEIFIDISFKSLVGGRKKQLNVRN